jgi:transposase InsO family protein
MGPSKGVYYQLYVIIDVYSRYITGWMIADRESADLATRFIEETCTKQRIKPDQLTVHADQRSSLILPIFGLDNGEYYREYLTARPRQSPRKADVSLKGSYRWFWRRVIHETANPRLSRPDRTDFEELGVPRRVDQA